VVADNFKSGNGALRRKRTRLTHPTFATFACRFEELSESGGDGTRSVLAAFRGNEERCVTAQKDAPNAPYAARGNEVNIEKISH